MTAVSWVLPARRVRVSVGGHDALVGAPGRLDRGVLICGEYAGESGVLAVGEQADTGAQHSADAVERITDPAAVPAGVLLDALAASVQRIAGQGDNMKRVHYRDCVGDFFSCGGLKAGEAVHGHDLDPVAERWCLGLEPGLEHLLGSAFDHLQQSRRSGAVANRGEVDDDGDELVPAAGVAPRVLIHAQDLDTVEAGRVGDPQLVAGRQDGVVAGAP